MLTGWRIEVYLMPPAVKHLQLVYHTYIQPFPSEVTKERMTNLRPLKHFYDFSVDLQSHGVLNS